MVPKICSVDGCGIGGYITRGWCYKHYTRWRRHGDVHSTSRIVGDRVASFWSKVDKSGECWLWTGARNPQGYGLFFADGRSMGAHIFSLELALQSNRPTDMDTCHRCDNPPCVRPEHLYFGTRQQNIDDAWERNRFPSGSARPSAKTTEVDVLAMRHEYADGADINDLSEAYGLATSTIRLTVLGYKWKHVGGPITRRRKSKTNRKVA